MGAPHDLDELVRRCRAGTAAEEDFRQLFIAFAPRVRRYFHRRGSHHQEVQDLTQETFLRVFRGLRRYRGDVDFPIWLYQIARNVLSNARRDQRAEKRRGELSAVSLDGTPGLDDATGCSRSDRELACDPLSVMLAADRTQEVWEAIRGLPSQMRRCLVLRVYQERTYDEIGAILGISTDTVKSHLVQARKRLRQAVASDGVSSLGRAEGLGEEA